MKNNYLELCIKVIMGIPIVVICVVIFPAIVVIGITGFLIQELKALFMMIDKNYVIKKIKDIGHYFIETLCSKFLCSIFVLFISIWLTLNFYWEDKDIYDVLIPIIDWLKNNVIEVATGIIAYFTFEMSKSVNLQPEQLRQSKVSEFISIFRSLVKEINGNELFSEIIEGTKKKFKIAKRSDFINLKLDYPKSHYIHIDEICEIFNNYNEKTFKINIKSLVNIYSSSIILPIFHQKETMNILSCSF